MTTCHWPQLCEDTVENHSIDRRRPGQGPGRMGHGHGAVAVGTESTRIALLTY